ncbi:SRPBCC family protein [Methyloceanibacter sp.]|uniref:SRPBCC family protein n=1 Tax=Methyloceanibacter sp. TaxID=1965321 RepID=UPI002D54B237|nr:SRPBCC family protein [Methyloceanibacter sp.]HZP08834.1 SRPBCC family protein [Methyloceanibacter sp.]
MLKKILIAIVVIIAALLIVVAVQPSEFRVERTAVIAAPAGAVFEQVNNLRKWDAWSPWAKLDPSAKVTFDGPDAGAGAAMGWSGSEKIGEGKMTIVESRPNEDIKIKVDIIKPHRGSIDSEFGFKPDGDKTDVSWVMSGHQNFVQKAFCLIMNGKKMMGDDLEGARPAQIRGRAGQELAATGAGTRAAW